MTPDTIEREITIAAPIEHVWAVLTGPEHIGRWFGPGTPARVDLRQGGSIVFDHPPHGEIPALIELVQAPELLVFHWVVTGPQDAEPTPKNASRVEFRLTPAGEGTVLRVTESGLARVVMTDQERRERYEANSAGWRHILDGLLAYAQARPA